MTINFFSLVCWALNYNFLVAFALNKSKPDCPPGCCMDCHLKIVLLLFHRKVVTSQDVPWVAMTVWGFTDSPVTWKNNEHGHFLSGENFYTFVIFPDDNYWLYTAMGSNDISL